MSDTAVVSYMERAGYYALEYVDTADHEFLYSLITPAVSAILEVPSGVGRNVLNIARSGCPIVAVDREPEMARMLRERLREAALPSPVEVIVGDLCSLDLGRRFDLILVPREAFQLVTSLEDAARALASLKRHLSGGGRLVVDISPFADAPDAPEGLRPDYFDAALADEVWAYDWQRSADDGTTIIRHHLQRHNGDGTLDVVFRYEIRESGGAVRSTKTTTRFRLYTAERFRQLADRAGLDVLTCYGDYERQPFCAGDARMIFILAEKPEDATQPAGLRVDSPGASHLFSRGFSNRDHARRIADWTSLVPREAVHAYFKDYAATYFSGPFVEGLGAEVILEKMYVHGGSGRALDLGAGTSTLFWYTPVRDLVSITCSDVAVEALMVLRDLVGEVGIPPCYQWIIGRFGLPPTHLADQRAKFDEWLVFSSLEPWPRWMDRERYDLITAFGNLALSHDEERYRATFREIAWHLSPGGRSIGADWVRKPAFARLHEHDNSYLGEPAVRQAMAAAKLNLVSCQRVEIPDDPLYDAIIVWVAEK